MEQVFQVTGLCVVGALLALVLKKGSPELALLLALAAVAAILLFLAGALGYDVTGKECPRFFVQNPDAWENFLAELAEKS